MATKKLIEASFLHLCEEYGLKTSSERGVDSYYKNSFYLLEFNKYYGYQIQKIGKTTGVVFCTPRMNAKEIYTYMQGLLDSLHFKTNEK